jgi:hypothetical protein
MPYVKLDRATVKMKPLALRKNKVRIERDAVDPESAPRSLSPEAAALVSEAAARIRQARAQQRPVILACGAHTIKNGLCRVLIGLIEQGWVTHLATNGAGIIHDWEFAFLGESSEDVRGGVERGEFGNWEETGYYINLALNVGSWEGRGYGESVGALIDGQGLTVPEEGTLEREAELLCRTHPEKAAASADLLSLVRRFNLPQGRLDVPHPHAAFSVQAAAFRLGVPFTGHPMFGHDIIYNHPLNHGASLGRAAERDFLTFAEAVSRLDGGVYLSVGSAVMSPMIFEKSMSMAQNIALQQGRSIRNHYLLISDLAESHWDWSRGEPPDSSPDYYLRYNKSFSRMGGVMRYLSADNRDFLLALRRELGPAR